VNIDAIPGELRDRPQWVTWRLEQRDGKPTKVPYRADGKGRADATDPSTWAPFGDALAAITRLAMDGFGYVFSADDPCTGVDLDNCLSGGTLHPAAAELVAKLDSYTEVSPSGTGVKIIVRASKNGNTRCRTSKTPWGGMLEAYDQNRFFALTGNLFTGSRVGWEVAARVQPSLRKETLSWSHQMAAGLRAAALPGLMPLDDRQQPVDDLFSEYLPAEDLAGGTREPLPVDLADQEILDLASNASNGADFEALWQGNLNGHGSQSEADLDLCGRLAFYTGRDPGRIDRMFRASGLMREKWERDDYRERTIEKAISGCSDTYSPTGVSRSETPAETPPFSDSALPEGNASVGGVSTFPPLRGETPPAETVPRTTVEFSFSTAEQFAAVEEESSEVLLGGGENVAMVAGGTGISFGDGGAGKSTLELDKALHLVTGKTWLGLRVPRKLRVLIVENDGPRGPFRKKIRKKLASWDGSDPEGRLHVLREPWGEVNVALEEHRQQLAAYIREHEIDLLLAGPIVSLGMIGGGTPDEVAAFEDHLRRLRALLERPLAIWLIHHENMRGQISGAWTRVPDTLVHVTATGNGHTRLFWKKARWSSELHGATWKLNWAAGESFELDVAPETTDEEIADALLASVQANPGGSWRAVLNAVGVVGGGTKKATIRDEMIKDGRLVNRGPAGGAFELWHPDDAALPPALDEESFA